MTGLAIVTISPDGDFKADPSLGKVLPLPTDTTKNYMFQPGTGWIEGPSKSNFADRVRAGGFSPITALADPLYGFAAGYVNTRGLPIGAGYNDTNAAQYADNAEAYLIISGAGATISSKNPTLMTTGTTDTGSAAFALGNTATGVPSGSVLLNQYKEIVLTGTSSTATISNSTERYTSELGLAYQGIANPMAWFSQVDNVNGAKYQFNYYDASGTLQTADTAVPAQAGATRTYSITFAWNAATSQFDMVATFTGSSINWTSSTITNIRLNNFLTSIPAFTPYVRITKSLGTTSRTLRFGQMLIIGTLR